MSGSYFVPLLGCAANRARSSALSQPLEVAYHSIPSQFSILSAQKISSLKATANVLLQSRCDSCPRYLDIPLIHASPGWAVGMENHLRAILCNSCATRGLESIVSDSK
jgi:hypothetical protein